VSPSSSHCVSQALHELCTTVVDAYAQRRVAAADRAARERGEAPLRRGPWRPPDYSTGLMAVVVALLLCDQVRALRTTSVYRPPPCHLTQYFQRCESCESDEGFEHGATEQWR
jgi:hypothetical protein